MRSSSHLSPERMPRAALISPDPTFRSLVTGCLDQSVPSVEWVLRAESDITELRPESVDRLAERAPELLFLDVGSSPSAGARYISAVTARLPGLVLVAAGGALDVDELLSLISAGASGYLRRPWSRDEVTKVCSGLLRKVPPTLVEAETAAPAGACNVVALFSPKGGTGVSTLSANLAVQIRRSTSKRTLLLDLSPELGTCSVLMGVEPRYSYMDVVENLPRMDEGLLYSFLEEHESGAWVLSSPAGVSTSGELSPPSVEALLRLMRRHFEYVVVDVGRGIIDGTAAETLELADERLMVTTAELPTLRNVKEILPRVARHKEPKEAVRLVVNRYEEGVSVPAKEVERAVGLPLFQVLNEDRERVGRSVNLGRPLVMNGSSPYARAVGQIGDRLAADDVPAKHRRSAGGLLHKLLPSFGRKSGRAEAANGTPPTSGAPQHPNGRPRPASEKGKTADVRRSASRNHEHRGSTVGLERPKLEGRVS